MLLILVLFNMSLSLSRDLTEAGPRHGIGLICSRSRRSRRNFTSQEIGEARGHVAYSWRAHFALLMSVVADVVEPALGECGRNCLVRVPKALGDARIILSARADLEIEGCPGCN